MKGLIKKSASIKSAGFFAVATTTVAVFALNFQELDSSASAACVCDAAESSYNSGLPASHPNNRCASQANDLSWKSWLSGGSRTNQFHFIDLFELLHGHENVPLDDVSPTNGKQNH